MANNIVKLNQVMVLEDQLRLSRNEKERMIQVMALLMEEFTREHRAATLRFLDFALGVSSSREVKERIASEYEKSYNEKVKKGDEHITNDKSITNGQYGGLLRHHHPNIRLSVSSLAAQCWMPWSNIHLHASN